jgi:hypothetical protein
MLYFESNKAIEPETKDAQIEIPPRTYAGASLHNARIKWRHYLLLDDCYQQSPGVRYGAG